MELLNNEYFKGIIVSVIASLILYYLFGIGKTKSDTLKKTQNILNINDKASVTGDILLNSSKSIISYLHPDEDAFLKISPEQIKNYLANLKPFDRKEASKKYEGMRVSWDLFVTNIYRNENKINTLYIIGTTFPQGTYPTIDCEINDKKYPEARNLDENQKIKINGRISSVESDGRWIYLVDCDLH